MPRQDDSARKSVIAAARIAGYHDDETGFTRIYIRAAGLAGNEVMRKSWDEGAKMKRLGVPCGCDDCKTAKMGALLEKAGVKL